MANATTTDTKTLNPAAADAGQTVTVTNVDESKIAFFIRKVVEFAVNVKFKLDTLCGFNDPLDAAVTWRTLARVGGVVLNGEVRHSTTGRNQGMVTVSSWNTYNGETDLTTPPTPTGFAVTAALATTIVTWDIPTFANYAYTEVWRNTTNSQSTGNFTRVGTTGAGVYSDNVGATSATRYYWIRHVSAAGVVGPYNTTTGTANTTSQVNSSDIVSLVASKITTGSLASDVILTSNLSAAQITAGYLNVDRIDARVIVTQKLENNAVSKSVSSSGSPSTTLGSSTSGSFPSYAHLLYTVSFPIGYADASERTADVLVVFWGQFAASGTAGNTYVDVGVGYYNTGGGSTYINTAFPELKMTSGDTAFCVGTYTITDYTRTGTQNIYIYGYKTGVGTITLQSYNYCVIALRK